MTLQKFKGCYKGFEGDRNLEAFQMRQKFRDKSKILDFHMHVKVGKISELADTRRYLKVSRISETC